MRGLRPAYPPPRPAMRPSFSLATAFGVLSGCIIPRSIVCWGPDVAPKKGKKKKKRELFAYLETMSSRRPEQMQGRVICASTSSFSSSSTPRFPPHTPRISCFRAQCAPGTLNKAHVFPLLMQECGYAFLRRTYRHGYIWVTCDARKGDLMPGGFRQALFLGGGLESWR